MDEMRIYDLQISQEKEDVKISVSIESGRLGFKELWFSTPKMYETCLCKSRMDGFLIGMLFPAMQYGEDIHVRGCISEKLLFNLNNYVVPLLLTFSPSCKHIKITADETSAERFDCNGVGTGFSGGVDSFCTIYDRLELESSPDYKINSLLFLNVGSHSWGDQKDFESAKNKFQERYNYLRKFTDEVGIDFITLDSNLHAFHPWGHQKTHTLTSAAGVLMLQSYYSKYYYASSGLSYNDLLLNAIRYKDVSVGAYCDPILLPLLSTESLELIPDGTQYTRTEKMLHIIDYEPVRRYLNVCVSSDDSHENCSVCSKCCRTLMTLSSVGKLDQFSHLFDIEKYQKKAERRYICEQMLVSNKDPYARQSIELARQHGVKLPHLLFCHIYCKAYWARRYVVKMLKAILPPAAINIIKGLMRREKD